MEGRRDLDPAPSAGRRPARAAAGSSNSAFLEAGERPSRTSQLHSRVKKSRSASPPGWPGATQPAMISHACTMPVWPGLGLNDSWPCVRLASSTSSARGR